MFIHTAFVAHRVTWQTFSLFSVQIFKGSSGVSRPKKKPTNPYASPPARRLTIPELPRKQLLPSAATVLAWIIKDAITCFFLLLLLSHVYYIALCCVNKRDKHHHCCYHYCCGDTDACWRPPTEISNFSTLFSSSAAFNFTCTWTQKQSNYMWAFLKGFSLSPSVYQNIPDWLVYLGFPGDPVSVDRLHRRWWRRRRQRKRQRECGREET